MGIGLCSLQDQTTVAARVKAGKRSHRVDNPGALHAKWRRPRESGAPYAVCSREDTEYGSRLFAGLGRADIGEMRMTHSPSRQTSMVAVAFIAAVAPFIG